MARHPHRPEPSSRDDGGEADVPIDAEGLSYLKRFIATGKPISEEEALGFVQRRIADTESNLRALSERRKQRPVN